MAKKELTALEEAMKKVKKAASNLKIDGKLFTDNLISLCDSIDKQFEKEYIFYIEEYASELKEVQPVVYGSNKIIRTKEERKKLYEFGENSKPKEKLKKIRSRAKEIKQDIKKINWDDIARDLSNCETELQSLSIAEIKLYKGKYDSSSSIAKKIKLGD